MSSSIDRTRQHRRSLFFMPIVGVFLSGCTTARTSDPAITEFTFEQHEVVLGSAERQTVVSGSFLDGPVADLAVVHIDENDDRRLRIYAFDDGAWAPRLDATLRPEVSFVDVADIDGSDRLITYGSDQLSWFDPGSSTEHALVAVTSDFSPPARDDIFHVDVTRDVNHDGRDDLVMPDGHGFRVLIQMEGGEFADPAMIGPSTGMGRVYGADGYRYDPWVQGGRVHEMDYDMDGRSDLVFWNDDHFVVHLQEDDGLFAPEGETFTIDVAFDSDELASLAAPEGARHRERDHRLDGGMSGRVLQTLDDMNGDGVADLVVFSLEGGNRDTIFGDTGALWNMRSTCEVHFGTPTPDGGIVFAPDVGAAVRSDGIPFGIGRHDFDHDGQVDMMVTIMDPGLFMAVGAIVSSILTRSVSVDLEFHRMEDGTYADKPDATRKVKAEVPPAEAGRGASFFPSVLIADVNGDGRSDLLVGRSQHELRVYPGVSGPDLFAQRPQRVAVAMPNEEYTWLVDLNKDGRQDILMHHPSTTEPHRVTMLIARQGRDHAISY